MWATVLSTGKIFGGLFLGWGIGANDSANVFGTAVATNSVRFRTAVILIAIFVVFGSILEGPKLFDEMKFSKQCTDTLALIATMAAALTVTFITYLSIPTSTSQAAVGAFMGIAVAGAGVGSVDWGKFMTMLICWIVNPIVSVFLCMALLKIFGRLLNVSVKSPRVRDRLIRGGLIVFGCYGAYALGANNVVVTTAPYYHAGMF
ncbi:MAG TPA: inorganic phosphate transporter, partial [bacterium]|nr:inorganic phosphate transporter [bacterium]